ncbi:MAG: hypothetical protein QME89_07025, partial [Actinomycetota bacterium]|nr:hypothetical protein [Actinomycetota bacterium]
VSVLLASDRPLAAERPMYFNYGGKWAGGHVVTGLSQPATSFLFAEGYTGEGFEEWLCLFNPDGQETAQAQITYCFTDGSTQKQVLEVPPRTRRTVFVNSVVGEGKEVSVLLASDRPLAAERPMYFRYGGKWEGGHVAVGLVP